MSNHKIFINDIRVFAYHGCLDAEGLIGSDYLVNVTLTTDFSEAMKSDDLKHTIDYVAVYDIVKEEMKIRAKLLEHVAHRILNRIKSELIGVKALKLEVSKVNPPMNGNVRSVSVILEEEF